MPEQQDMGHASRTLQILQDAEDEGIDASDAIEDLTSERDTWECADCERLHFSRAEAFRCCRSSGDQGGEPA